MPNRSFSLPFALVTESEEVWKILANSSLVSPNLRKQQISRSCLVNKGALSSNRVT